MREYLMLAQTYNQSQNVTDWFMSEKLDGMRAFWDGGVSIGKQVPWGSGIGTGLWSRYGKPIHAPSWWTKALPPVPLDGELWLGYGKFQEVMSICRTHKTSILTDARWQDIKYKVFDAPSYDQFFTTGQINNPNCKLIIDHDTCMRYIKNNMTNCNFNQVYQWLSSTGCDVVKQIPIRSWDHVQSTMRSIVDDQGGEGLVFRYPMSFWHPSRSRYMLKYKPFLDSEAKIIGYIWGDGKYTGMLGSLLVSWGNHVFSLSGMTNDQRVLLFEIENRVPGTLVPDSVISTFFTRGKFVTFRYDGLSDSGVPLKARFLRRRENA